MHSAEPTKPRRRWFRYSLGSLFILLTVLGIWLGVQVNWIHGRHEAQRWIDEHPPTGPTVSPYLNLLQPVPGNASGIPSAAALVQPHLDAQAMAQRRLPWSLRLLGEAAVPYIYIDGQATSAAKEASIRRLFPEAHVEIVGKRAP